MPLVQIPLARRDTPTTAGQIAALIAGITDLMQSVFDQNRESVVVIIDGVDPVNWGVGREPVTSMRARRKSGRSPRLCSIWIPPPGGRACAPPCSSRQRLLPFEGAMLARH
ncbi:4-oxalocrotonate tautomerase family protein [Hydrogenophaga sp.]|uniref:tautomerase family protein n=1 Tax=Hydrogenophaga sp. TaxID=1904254 RepID=UPI002715DD92|nr:4-oxalocrotonate tautomerase family protein [Hydrogenophaga sp.]MDO8906151.1 4-oxalocrotonate tautomerase family protein [Hydrogenophaga sp.]